jgi:hypothetical protein
VEFVGQQMSARTHDQTAIIWPVGE